MLLEAVNFVSTDVFDGWNWTRVIGLLPPSCITVVWECEICNNTAFLFVLQCNVFYSLGLSLFFIAYETQYVFQQPGFLKRLVLWTYIYVLGCWFYNWTLFLWFPNVHKCNRAAKEIYNQQPNICKKLLYEDNWMRIRNAKSRDAFRTLSNIYDEGFQGNVYGCKWLTIFESSFNIAVWQSFKYVFEWVV